jgi:hypothetical protein
MNLRSDRWTLATAQFTFDWNGAHLFDGITLTLYLALEESNRRTTIFFTVRRVFFQQARQNFWLWSTSSSNADGQFEIRTDGNVYRAPIVARPTLYNVPPSTQVSTIALTTVFVEFWLASSDSTKVFVDCMELGFWGHLPVTPRPTPLPTPKGTPRTSATSTTATTTTTTARTSLTTTVGSDRTPTTEETSATSRPPTTTTTTTTTEAETEASTISTTDTVVETTTTDDTNVVIIETRGSLPFMFSDPEDTAPDITPIAAGASPALTTFGQESSDETLHADHGMWIGIGIGAFVLLCLAIALVFLVHRRREKKNRPDDVAALTLSDARAPLERRPTAVAQVRPMQSQYGKVAPLSTASSQYDVLSNQYQSQFQSSVSPRREYEQPGSTFKV